MKTTLNICLLLCCISLPMHALAAPEQKTANAPKLPPLSLTKQFAGPLQDTTIQRFADPDTGVLCYLYTPYVVRNARDESGSIVYGANNIGSISCVAPWKDGNVKENAPKK